MKPLHRTILQNGGFKNFEIKTIKEVEDLSLLHFQEGKKIIEDCKNIEDYILMNARK